MKKRILTSVFALVLCLSFAVLSTAETDKPYAGTKLRFSSFQTGAVEEDWLNVQFPRFKEETGIEVEHVFINHTDTISTLMTWMAADMGPDCAMVSARYENAFAANGLLVDLGAYIEEKRPDISLDRYFPNLLTAYQYNGLQYALPSDLDLGVTWFNRDMFDAAGVAYPEKGWTWDDYRATAEALTTGEGPTKVFGSEMPPIQIFLWQAGADYVSADGKTCTINTPEAKTAYEFVLGMINDGLVPAPGSEGVGMDSGKAAMSMGNGAWYAFYTLNDVAFQWDIAPMPVGEEAATTAYGSTFVVLQSSENVDAAVEFINWFLSDEQQFIRAKQFCWFPPAKTVLDYPGFADFEVLSLTLDQKQMFMDENEHGRAPVVIAKQSEMSQIISREESLIWAGEKSIEDALKTMEQEITPLL